MKGLPSTVLRDVIQLLSGTAIGRLILLAAMPLVTRLYSPKDFELLAVYAALVGTVAVVACLRFEIAIPLAENDDDAIHLLALSLMSVAGVVALIFLLTLTLPQQIAELVGSPGTGAYMWLIALGVAMTASYSALQFWAARNRRFGAIARTRVGQATTGAVTMLGFGWLGLAPMGLLLGNMFSLGGGGLSLAAQVMRWDRAALRVLTRRGLAATLGKYRRYPIFSTPEALANVAGIQVPILMIAAMAEAEAGQLFLAMQIMAAPMTLLGASVGQVYASRAQEELRNGTLYRFTLSMMRRLFLICLVPMAAAALLAPQFFPVVFGAEWARAGVIVTWIAPWMLLQLTVSPVSMGLHVTGNQRIAMSLHVFGLALRVGSVGAAALIPGIGAVEGYATSGALFYGLCAIIVLGAIRKT
ncbi:lipopolysaccharide biosynthesis protein [Sphingobium cupriresistens]|nr:oligosaccharide flippase family protein [Sphingobium cupriresistens]